MPDCKYPHQVKVCLTDEAFQALQKEIYVRHTMGDIAPTIANVILVNILAKIENNDIHPVWLGMDDIKKEKPSRKTIVPCKECHEYPCTCECKECHEYPCTCELKGP